MMRTFTLVLLFHHAVLGKLQVTMGDVTTQPYYNALIPGLVTGYNTPELYLHNVGVKWVFRAPNGTEKEIYSFNGVNHTSTREGSQITEEELKKGNVSLFIPRVQISEAGSYKCTVFVSSNKAEGISSLSVSAIPKVALSSLAISVEVGAERSISCAVSHFYPPNIEVQWFEVSEGAVHSVGVGICTGSLIDNPDGTFNVTSRLRLRPSLADNKKQYTCTVEHPTLSKNLARTVALSVTEPTTWYGVIIGCIFGAIIAAMPLIAFPVYIMRFKPVPPKLTDISVPLKLEHKEKANISFQVTGFRPRIDTISCFLKMNTTGRECKRIFHWTHKESNCKGQLNPSIGKDEIQLLVPGEEEEDAHFFVKLSPFEKHKDSTSSISGNITAFPDVWMHDGASLSIQVCHKALTTPLEKEVVLQVGGVPPRLSKILMPHAIVQHEDCILTCLVSCFKPKPLKIFWYRINNGQKHAIVEVIAGNEEQYAVELREPAKYTHSISDFKFEDHSYCVTSMIKFKPTVLEHDESVYLCETLHDTTGKQVTSEVKLHITAVPVLNPIQHSPSVLRAGEDMTLSCKIHSFFPKKIEIFWFKDGTLMKEKPENSNISTENGLFYCESKITFLPNKMDQDKKITCSIKHASLMESKEVEWNMVPILVPPRISEISCDPPNPELGELVTLTCAMEEFFPEQITVLWLHGDTVRTSRYDTKEENPRLNPETGLFHSKTSITFRATREDHGKEIFVDVLHYATMVNPERRQFLLLLKGVPTVSDLVLEPRFSAFAPVVSEIKMTPAEPEIGQPLTLRVDIKDYAPGDIQVRWFKSNCCFDEEISTTEPQIGKNGLCFSESQVQFRPSGQDHNRQLKCEIMHPGTNNVTEKTCTLTLKGFSRFSELTNYPKTSLLDKTDASHRKTDEQFGMSTVKDTGVLKIQCVSVNAKAGEEVTLSCHLPGCHSNDTEVYWYKGIYPVNITKIRNEDFEGGCISYVTVETSEVERECEIRCEVFNEESRQDACYTLKLI